MSPSKYTHVTLIGGGTIGLSLAALHIENARPERPLRLVIHDTRPDIENFVLDTLPKYVSRRFEKGIDADGNAGFALYHIGPDYGRETGCWVYIDYDVIRAVSEADIIQEQGPENADFKIALWPRVEMHCPPHALLWSSTSGIPASTQSSQMKDPSRLLVVHPYNPPHIMPLLEVVPSPQTSPDVISRTMTFWGEMGRSPVVLKKESTGFVANRLAFALLREAIHLVNEGVASVEDIDEIVQTSMGPRWAVAGPFKSYHAGGGKDGLEGFFKNIGQTVQACWDDGGTVNVGEGWEEEVFMQTEKAYGIVDTGDRDFRTQRVLDAVKEPSEK